MVAVSREFKKQFGGVQQLKIKCVGCFFVYVDILRRLARAMKHCWPTQN